MTSVAVTPVPSPAPQAADANRPAAPDKGDDREFANVLASSVSGKDPNAGNGAPAEEKDTDPVATADATVTGAAPAATGTPAATNGTAHAEALTTATSDPAASGVADPALLAALANRSPDAASGADTQRSAPGETLAIAAAGGRNGSTGLAQSPELRAGDASGTSRTNDIDPSALHELDAGASEAESLTDALASFETLLADASRTQGGGQPAGDPGLAANTLHAGATQTHGTKHTFGPSPWETPRPEHYAAIPTPITEPAWASEAGGVVRLMIQDQVSQAQVRIDPPDLGPIEVRMTMDGDRAAITFHAAVPETRALLENHLHRLREAMQGAGVELGQATVGGQAQSDWRSPSQNRESDRGTDRERRTNEPAPVAATAIRTRMAGTRLVDTFA